MSEFYNENALSYFERTVSVDPAGFLEPFVNCLEPGARLLDVGCGSGRDLLWLRERGFQVKGIERSPALAGLAREHSGSKVVQGDFVDWDFAADPVDGILLVGALVHVPHEKLGRVLRHVTGGLVPGGKVLLTLKEGEGVGRGAGERVFYLWQDGELRGLLNESGFQVLCFQRAASAIRDKDTWLTYVIKRL